MYLLHEIFKTMWLGLSRCFFILPIVKTIFTTAPLTFIVSPFDSDFLSLVPKSADRVSPALHRLEGGEHRPNESYLRAASGRMFSEFQKGENRDYF